MVTVVFGEIGAWREAPIGGVMDWMVTESTLIEKIWLELADVAGFKLELYASGHPGSGTQMLR
jgi:hypothetical protein